MSKIRVILKYKNELKRFFFMLQRPDGTICLGLSYKPKQDVKMGKFQIPEEGTSGQKRLLFSDAEQVKLDNYKFSYHPSMKSSQGKIHVKGSQGNYLLQYPVSRLSDMKEYRKIFIILPQDPIGYPKYEKNVGEKDLVIPIDSFNNKPFCIYIFVANKQIKSEEVVAKNTDIQEIRSAEIKDYRLIVQFAHYSRFLKWCSHTVFVPYIDGVDLETFNMS